MSDESAIGVVLRELMAEAPRTVGRTRPTRFCPKSTTNRPGSRAVYGDRRHLARHPDRVVRFGQRSLVIQAAVVLHQVDEIVHLTQCAFLLQRRPDARASTLDSGAAAVFAGGEAAPPSRWSPTN